MRQIYWLVLGILCAWRITHLLQAEDGPWNLILRLRTLAGKGFPAQLLDCFYCLSLWVAAPLAWVVGETLTERLLHMRIQREWPHHIAHTRSELRVHGERD